MLFMKGGRKTIFRNLLLNLRVTIEDSLEPHRTTDVVFLEELDRVEYSRLAKPKGLRGEF
jgi:hypothetical protein